MPMPTLVCGHVCMVFCRLRGQLLLRSMCRSAVRSGDSRRGSTSAPDALSRGGLFAVRLVATVPFSVLRLSARAGQNCSVAAASACCAEPPASVTGLPALLAAPPALSAATGVEASAGAARLRPDDKAFAPALAAASGAAAASSPPLLSPLDCPALPVRASATCAAEEGKLARCRGGASLPEPQLLSWILVTSGHCLCSPNWPVGKHKGRFSTPLSKLCFLASKQVPQLQVAGNAHTEWEKGHARGSTWRCEAAVAEQAC